MVRSSPNSARSWRPTIGNVPRMYSTSSRSRPYRWKKHASIGDDFRRRDAERHGAGLRPRALIPATERRAGAYSVLSPRASLPTTRQLLHCNEKLPGLPQRSRRQLRQLPQLFQPRRPSSGRNKGSPTPQGRSTATRAASPATSRQCRTMSQGSPLTSPPCKATFRRSRTT